MDTPNRSGYAEGMSDTTWPAAVAETHVSILFLVGDRVYKLKKPVRTGFLDHTSRSAREAVCHREVELNRRMAPDVYLGVADIRGPDGEICDHLVVMQRMPEDARLSTLLSSDPVRASACIDAVAELVASFHEQAARSNEIDAAGTAEALLRNWRDNASQMQPFIGSLLDPTSATRLMDLAERYIEGRRPLIDERIKAGRIRDGHGDLLADDIFCLPDGPRILDCIEFDDRLRYGDVIVDAAFLVMDLKRLGAPETAGRFIDRYLKRSHDDAPRSLLHHHVAYRAQVRCKVACLRHDQGDEAAADEARQLLDLCIEHLERARIRLVLVGGLPGTGKSTLARHLASELGWTLVRSDEVRKALHASAGDASARFGEGLYSPAATDATYRELLRRAHRSLEQGVSVVLDASWITRHHRHAAREVASETRSDLVEFRCVAPDAVAEDRIRQRNRDRSDPSDATPDVAAEMARHMDPWPESTALATARPREEVLLDALRLISEIP